MSVELQINNKASASARYIGYSPAPCRIRQTTAGPPLDVRVSNAGTRGKVVFYGTGAKPTTSATSTLALSVPGDGSWSGFWIGGQFEQASVADGDAAVKVEDVAAPNVPLTTLTLMVRVRKNANTLSPDERDRFVAALAALNNKGAGLFQTFRDMHVDASTDEAHGAQGFLPWHRAYLLDLERELQNIDRSVALPYWRFDEPAPGLFTPEFMGRTPPNKLYAELSASNPLQFWATDGIPGIQRRPGFNTAVGAAHVITEAQTLALGQSYDLFRQMEGSPHGLAHTSFVQGWIGTLGTAAKDPLFFLLHCNVDRLWAKWQFVFHRFDAAGATSYDSANAKRIGHHLPDSMWPWNGVHESPRPLTAPGGGLAVSPCVSAPGTQPIVSSQLDFQGRIDPNGRLGFDYDDVPYP